MYPSTVSLALKGAKSAYDAYADYRDKKAAELYDTMQEAKAVAEKRNKAAVEKASSLADDALNKLQTFGGDVTSEAESLRDRASEGIADLKKAGEKKRCKARREAKKARKDAAKRAKSTRKDLEKKVQQTADKLSGKEARRAKAGRVATGSIVFAVVAAVVAAIIWKLKSDDKLPVDPAPVKQKAAEVKDTVAAKAGEAKDVADKPAETAADKAEESKAEIAEEGDVDGDVTPTEVKVQSEVKAPKPNAPKPGGAKAPKPGNAKK